MIHTVKGFGVISKVEIDVLMEFPCFFYDAKDVDNLISGSSAFSKPSLNIWKFSVHVKLKLSMENLENSSVSTGLERVSFHFNTKEKQCQRMFKLPDYCTHFTC